MPSHGEYAKTVKRPSCEATSASRVALIVNELCTRQVTRRPDLSGRQDQRRRALNRLCERQLLDLRSALAAGHFAHRSAST